MSRDGHVIERSIRVKGYLLNDPRSQYVHCHAQRSSSRYQRQGANHVVRGSDHRSAWRRGATHRRVRHGPSLFREEGRAQSSLRACEVSGGCRSRLFGGIGRIIISHGARVSWGSPRGRRGDGSRECTRSFSLTWLCTYDSRGKGRGCKITGTLTPWRVVGPVRGGAYDCGLGFTLGTTGMTVCFIFGGVGAVFARRVFWGVGGDCYVLLNLLTYLSPIFKRNSTSAMVSTSRRIPTGVIAVGADIKALGTGLCSSIPGRIHAFVRHTGQNRCGKALFAHMLPRFVVRNNTPSSHGTPTNTHYNFKSQGSRVVPRVQPRRFGGQNTLTTPHRGSSVGPRGGSSVSRFCVMRKGICADNRLSALRVVTGRSVGRGTVRGFFCPIHTRLHVRGTDGGHRCRGHLHGVGTRMSSVMHTAPKRLLFAGRRQGTCAARNNYRRLSNGCAMCNRLVRKFSILSVVTKRPHSRCSHPGGSVHVVRLAVSG